MPTTLRAHQKLAGEVEGCRRCDLYRNATHGVIGQGNHRAKILLVGEQPGDQEDLAGLPFVGPAGKMLDRILEAAGIAREDVYLTNAVKHFKWTRSGKRRLHQKPNAAEVKACNVWLENEMNLVKPKIVGCLGATAARAVLGKLVTISAVRGQLLTNRWGIPTMITVHPSSLLRAPTPEARAAAMASMTEDLKKLRARAKKL